jgi:hypothetical protein
LGAQQDMQRMQQGYESQNEALQRQLQAMQYIPEMEMLPWEQAGMAMDYGERQRQIDQAGLDADYEEELRLMTENNPYMQNFYQMISAFMGAEQPVAESSGSCAIIITAVHGADSYEVNIAREFRDKCMPVEDVRGYYKYAEKVVPLLKLSSKWRKFFREFLVDKWIRYAEWILGYKDKPSQNIINTAKKFLIFCKVNGQEEPYKRDNGEVI